MSNSELRQKIQEELRDLRYPWYRPISNMIAHMETVVKITQRQQRRKQPAKAPQNKLPYSIK